uniref:Ovule protein n=1 Tax=Steinernema glaseri TaxID=37863 RepID=A0A1I7XYQ4_9BILA
MKDFEHDILYITTQYSAVDANSEVNNYQKKACSHCFLFLPKAMSGSPVCPLLHFYWIYRPLDLLSPFALFTTTLRNELHNCLRARKLDCELGSWESESVVISISGHH